MDVTKTDARRAKNGTGCISKCSAATIQNIPEMGSNSSMNEMKYLIKNKHFIQINSQT